MNRFRSKSLQAASAVVAIALMLGVFYVQRVQRQGEGGPAEYGARPYADSMDSRLSAEREVATITREARAFETETLDLNSRYRTVKLHDGTRDLLYEVQDFGAVEVRLSAELSACESPLEFLRYSKHIESLCRFESPYDALSMLDALNDWVAARPESYHARLIRSGLGYSYYWKFNGAELSEANRSAGWLDADSFLDQSREDLETALRLNSSDPEIPRWQLRVARARNGRVRAGAPDAPPIDDEALAVHLQEALARQPRYLPAYLDWLDATFGNRQGPLPFAEAVAADAAAEAGVFPLLALVPLRYQSLLPVEGDPIESLEKYWAREKTLAAKALAAYEAQLALEPGDIHLMADAAYYGSEAGRWERATHWFQQLGDAYPADGEFTDVSAFNHARAKAYREYAKSPALRGTPLVEKLLAEADSIRPVHFENPVLESFPKMDLLKAKWETRNNTVE